MGREAAIDKVADLLKIDRTTVRRALRKYEPDVKIMLSFLAEGGDDAPSVRYETDRGALSQHFMP
jgi:hypothetical protein